MSEIQVSGIGTGQNRLVLYPLDQSYRVQDPKGLVQHLQSIGFVETVVSKTGNSGQLLPGSNFMRHLTFLGCSPSVGSGNQRLSYNNYSVLIDTSSDSRRVIAGRRVKSPSCSACSNKGSHVQIAEAFRLLDDNVVWACPVCNAARPVDTINWHNKLAVATHFIVVNGVFEGEAIPADKFLDQLGTVSGVTWSYCYC